MQKCPPRVAILLAGFGALLRLRCGPHTCPCVVAPRLLRTLMAEWLGQFVTLF
jgi:hypothetical protein